MTTDLRPVPGADLRPAPGPGGALDRVVRAGLVRTGPDGERCDLCAAPVPSDHRHLLDESNDALLCLCRACALLFDRDAAARGHYRLVPQRRLRVADLDRDGSDPRALGIPVGLAFVIPGDGGEVRARYPSPIGATRWELEPAAWRRLVARAPMLAGLAPRVEALLANTARGRREFWIVPIDDCYRLVAIVRHTWTGLSGGGRVWPAVDDFFAALPDRSRRGSPLGRAGSPGAAGD
ncbi:hypothetical protein FF36_04061 [Frankia torreyi]|uniref:Uncharacterized protein n=1 Tax=Frankia torreyi TaxID=1856 RepID=A0A0D8BCB1_9ACTN|nr:MULTISPECIES: DUF5947 family protein [unclassified Frankia]KJE21604.1 hypothetical protein FF36_04061 [Frankia torreyi]KQM03705.1 hypothetical protein FF86_103643 [Frankia sp. CpI1-P]